MGSPEGQEAHELPRRLLLTSFRALIPTLIIDVGGTMGVYYLLASHFSHTSIWPLLGASLVPSVSNIYNFIRRRTVDIVGIIILIGLIGSIIPAVFGSSQRLLLVRESFITGAVGVALLISGFLRRPLGYHVMREFLTANEALPVERFQILWKSSFFRRGVRTMTIVWGALLLGDFVLRGFMALRMNIAVVLGIGPVVTTALLLLAGFFTAIWLGWAMKKTLQEHIERDLLERELERERAMAGKP
jgi:hypothetical protein